MLTKQTPLARPSLIILTWHCIAQYAGFIGKEEVMVRGKERMTSKPRSSVQVTSTEGKPINAAKDDGRSVIWFDLDNCVYSKNSGISEMMKDKIRAYFRKLGLPEEEAAELHHVRTFFVKSSVLLSQLTIQLVTLNRNTSLHTAWLLEGSFVTTTWIHSSTTKNVTPRCHSTRCSSPIQLSNHYLQA